MKWCHIEIHSSISASTDSSLSFPLCSCRPLNCNRQFLNQRQPLNPILGETFQGSFSDGTQIYLEQVSHHPPISAFDLELAGKWRLTGVSEAVANVAGANSVEVGRHGLQRVRFASDGAEITFRYPRVIVNGAIYGSRCNEILGEVTFTDEQNDLVATLKFDSESVKGACVRARSPNRHFVGVVPV